MTSIILCLFYCLCIGQTDTPILQINKTSESIQLDGILDEEVWRNTERTDSFQIKYSPEIDTVVFQTEVMMTYDDNHLYIAAICHDNQPEKEYYVTQSLKRDFAFKFNDAFAVFIDAFGDKNSGLSFSVTPNNVQGEGTIEKGGHKGVTPAWNGYWESEVHTTRKYWSLEMKIPFKTLNYSTKRTEWRINFARSKPTKDIQRTTWVKVPRKINLAMLGHTGTLKWDKAPPPPKGKVSLIPYLIAHTTRNLEDSMKPISFKYPPVGGDAKFSISPSLTMDLTVNPDFSEVEVDQQIVNIGQFEVNLPEQRPFFLENSDMFSLLGNSRVSPVRTRRIGGADSSPVPILFGLKLSGDIGRKWRVGLLNVQTQKTTIDSVINYSNNYLVASASRKFIRESHVGVLTSFITNRQSFANGKDYNLTGGLEYNYRKGSKLSGHTYFNMATTEDRHKDFLAYGFKGRYKTPERNYYIGADIVGKHYTTDMGFVPRLSHKTIHEDDIIVGYAEFRTNGKRTFYPKEREKIDNHGFEFGLDVFTDNLDFSEYYEHESYFGWQMSFSNTGTLRVRYKNDKPILFDEFAQKGLENIILDPKKYPINSSGKIEYQRGKRSKFNWGAGFEYGQRFTGKNMIADLELAYRPTRWSAFTINSSYTKLFDFAPVDGEADIILIRAKTEFSFPKRIFWTNLLQFNNIDAEFSINSRLQWNYKPASDLFLVVTNNNSTIDNMGARELKAKNWQVILKWSHWFNVQKKDRKKQKEKKIKDF